MKIKSLLILAILFAFSCQNTPKENTEQAEATINQNVLSNVQKVEINIEGMTCTGCENAIQNKIKEFDGIYSVIASHEQGIATIEIDSTKADILKIEEAINELGYKATAHKNISE